MSRNIFAPMRAPPRRIVLDFQNGATKATCRSKTARAVRTSRTIHAAPSLIVPGFERLREISLVFHEFRAKMFAAQKFEFSKKFNFCGLRRRGGGPSSRRPEPRRARAAAAAEFAKLEIFCKQDAK